MGKNKLAYKNTYDTIKSHTDTKPKEEFNFRLVALIGFIVSFLLLVFSYYYFGSFFETNDDPRYVMAMKGFASPLPFDNFVTLYQFTSKLYIWLYQHYANIAWYGLSMFFMLWGTLFNIFLSFYLLAKNIIHFLLIVGIFVSFFFLIFFQNVYLINFTRPSLLATGSFIILLSVLYLNENILSQNKWVLLIPILTYIFAHLTRLDAGYLGFVFGIGFSIVFLYKQKSISPFLLKYMLPVLCFIILIKIANTVSIKIDKKNVEFIEKTETLRQLIDYKNAAAYVPKDAKDTVAYDALISFRWCNDNSVISLNFIKKLLRKSPLLKSGNQTKFNSEFDTFKQSLGADNISLKMINICLFILMLIWFITAIKNNTFVFVQFLLFELFFAGIIVGMCYYMKLPERIFHPLLVLLSVGNILFVFSKIKFDKNNMYYFTLAPMLLLVLSSISKNLEANKIELTKYQIYGEVNQSLFDDINSRFKNTIFIPTVLRSWETHKATDPINEITFKNNNSYVYLSIELCLAPETEDQLITKFGTKDHALLFKKISEMDNVFFISDANYLIYLQDYYHTLYNQEYIFEKVSETLPPFYSRSKLNYYRLKKAQ